MKRIFLSLITVGVVSAAGVMATRAFFSDVETAKGNTFQAGTLNLTIDSTQHYNGRVCENGVWVGEGNYPTGSCNGTWPSKDLTAEKFFDFADVKPGDYGENTISLTVNNNPAWACVSISPISANGTSGLALADGLQFFAWDDTNCNNQYEPGQREFPLFSNPGGIGSLSDVLNGKVYPLADAGTGSPFEPGQTRCLGLAWCAGTMTIANGAFVCDGGSLGNNAQGGSVSADVSFYVEQTRNNPDFRCGQVFDYLDIGNAVSEAGHNLSGWSDAWVKPGWGGNYGGGSSDNSLRLLMGRAAGNNCDEADRQATFTMNAGSGTATKLTLEHLDGAVNDSFDLYINDVLRGHYEATSTGGNEIWKTTTFTFPGVTGTVNVKLYAAQPVTGWCLDWGQVAFSNAKLQ